MNKNIKKAILTLTIFALAAASVFAATGTAVSNETGLRNAFANGGTYYLSSDITLTQKLSTAKTVTLDLNGHTITAGSYSIEASSSTAFTLTIKDSSTGQKGKIVGDVSVKKNAVLTLQSGTIVGDLTVAGTKNQSNQFTEMPTVTVSGGSVEGNVSAIYSYFTVSGGSVGKNKAVVRIESSFGKLTSGSITGDLQLAGAFNSNGKTANNLEVTGGTINGNITSENATWRIEPVTGSSVIVNGNITTSGTGSASIYVCTINGNLTVGGSEDLGCRIHEDVTINGDLNSVGATKVRTYDGVTVTGDLNATGSGGFKLRAGDFLGDINVADGSKLEIEIDPAENGGDITFADDPSDYLNTSKKQYCYYNSEGVYHLLTYKPVAVIGDTPYSSISAALAAAQEGDIIVLNQSLTEDVTINKNVTIDIAGQTLKGNINSASGTTVNLVDTKGTGLSDGLLNNGSSGTIKITSGSFSTDPSAYVVGDDKFVKYDREKSVYTVTTPNNTVSLTLGGDIGINLFVDADSYTDDSKAYIELVYDRLITIKGENLPESEIIELDGSGYDVDKLNRVMLTVSMGPVQLINSVSIYLYETDPNNGPDKLLYSKENYTPVEFCQSVVKNASSYDSELVELCKTLLNYGSMTQTYFKAQTSNLPNAGLNISGNVTSLDTSEWTDYYGEFDKNLPDYKGTSLICSTNMVVRHYFKDPIDDYTVTLSSKPEGSAMGITTGDNSTGYYVEVYGIESPYLDDDYTITLKDAKGNTYTITYSPMCYARKTVSRSTSDASLVNLCKSIYLYGSAAKEYFIAE